MDRVKEDMKLVRVCEKRMQRIGLDGFSTLLKTVIHYLV